MTSTTTATRHYAHLVTEHADRDTHGGPEVLVFPEWDGKSFTPPVTRGPIEPGEHPFGALYRHGWRPVPGATETEPATGYKMVEVERYEVVTTPELNEGDLVDSHGMRIRLGARHERPAHIDPRGVVWFPGTVENYDEIAADPHHVTRGLLGSDRQWTVQGNQLAHWTRLPGA